MKKDTINFISFKDQKLPWIKCSLLKYGGYRATLEAQ